MWDDETYYQVAVFWPIRGSTTQGDYGGIERCKTVAEAASARDRTIKLGYKPENIHIRKVKIKRINPTEPGDAT